ncbi:unnamed protein product [Rhodiola kirilowii]
MKNSIMIDPKHSYHCQTHHPLPQTQSLYQHQPPCIPPIMPPPQYLGPPPLRRPETFLEACCAAMCCCWLWEGCCWNWSYPCLFCWCY